MGGGGGGGGGRCRSGALKRLWKERSVPFPNPVARSIAVAVFPSSQVVSFHQATTSQGHRDGYSAKAENRAMRSKTHSVRE